MQIFGNKKNAYLLFLCVIFNVFSKINEIIWYKRVKVIMIINMFKQSEIYGLRTKQARASTKQLKRFPITRLKKLSNKFNLKRAHKIAPP